MGDTEPPRVRGASAKVVAGGATLGDAARLAASWVSPFIPNAAASAAAAAAGAWRLLLLWCVPVLQQRAGSYPLAAAASTLLANYSMYELPILHYHLNAYLTSVSRRRATTSSASMSIQYE